ncbi:MAG: hypothetical protein PHC99_07615 [Methylococcales bacterium]|nr:hypothetical protein [Methylococcales bacterium]
MKFQHYCLLCFVWFFTTQAQAITQNDDPYILLPTKAYIESCQKKALQLHQGNIEKQQVLHRNVHFIMQYEIQSADGSEWVVQCDLETGQLIEQND